MKNRAAYMVGLNKMEIRETPVPEPKAGEVLVKIEYVGICGSDVHYFKDGRCGDFVVDGELMLGHEAGGFHPCQALDGKAQPQNRHGH